ncbi:RNA polymerase sigma factor [Streptomyces sp. XY413]|uniref:RNA polymerase sigma factor n=1 Tax=Streptomyces sp. XY413 TaxID=1519479 RepID=UPI000AF8B875|nr:RNA polymerase sigma factor [Streptomyces sp. XY413]
MTPNGGTNCEADSGEGTASASQARFLALYEDLYPQITHHLRRKFPAINRASAEDIAAEVFLRAYRDWDHIGELRNPAGYLFKAAQNRALDIHRRLQREPLLDDGLLDELATRSNPLERAAQPAYPGSDSSDPAKEVARQAVGAMRPSRRRQVALLQQQGLTDIEIATVLGISRNQVQVQRHHAVRELREQLKRYIRSDSERRGGSSVRKR